MRANSESFKSWLLADREQVEMPGLYQKKARASKEQSDDQAELCQLKKFCLSSEPDYVFRQFTAGNYVL